MPPITQILLRGIKIDVGLPAGNGQADFETGE